MPKQDVHETTLRPYVIYMLFRDLFTPSDNVEETCQNLNTSPSLQFELPGICEGDLLS
jgi:hypothetical protein